MRMALRALGTAKWYIFATMRLPPNTEAAFNVARCYRRLLEGRFGARLAMTRVFGSQARGDGDVDSDIDVLVVIRGLTEQERTEAIDLAVDAWKTSRSTGPLSPLVWSECEFEDRVRSERRIAADVMAEGVVP